VLTTEVAARLERKLGLGAFPLIRRRMFQRLQRLAVQHGDPVLEIVSQVELEALGPNVRDKGQYFCWVVKRRLAELGFPLDGVPSLSSPAASANVVKEVVRRQAAANDASREVGAIEGVPHARGELRQGFVACAVCGHAWPERLGSFPLTVTPLHGPRGGADGMCPGSGRDLVVGGGG
jgi:hypothetical protein